MAGVITTGNYPKALWPGLNAIWGRTYDEKSQQWTMLFDRHSSDQAYEEDLEATGFGLVPKKPEGVAVGYDSETQGVVTRYTHVAYGMGFKVTHEEQMDNLYEKVSKRRTRALAFSFRQTKESVAANVYNRAFNSSYTGGDGKELLATDHPTLDGTQSNELATAADLSEASLEDLTIQIRKAKNSRGLRIALQPTRLIVPPDLQYEATRILKSELQNDSANNAVNALRTMGIVPEIFVNDYLTDADAWFIRTNAPDCLKYFDRESLTFAEDNDFDTKNQCYAGYERYSFGWSDWRGIYGSPGA